jgi:hypothetical protein
MARHGFGMATVGLGCWLLTGCATLPDWAQPKASLASELTAPLAPGLVRMQMSDGPGVSIKKPIQPPAGVQPPPGIAPPPGLQQVSLTRNAMRVVVRVWVNGRPIFDDEVMQMAGPDMDRARRTLSEPQRSNKTAEILNAVIDTIIDQELMQQDAVKKLEKHNPRGLDKLKEYVEQEFDKAMARMRKANESEERIRELEPVARRILERSLISQEYARSRIKPILESRIGLTEVREYYEAHKKEFKVDDRIIWQDIFIPLNPNQPTVDMAKQFAEELISRISGPDGFNQLMVYNQGDSKLRGGEGLGHKRGEIRPAELEEHLFRLEPGDIGPVVAFATGVHIFRVTKKERAGVLPLNDETQKIIRKKLENEVADREYRRIIRELRQRAVIRIEKDSP